MTTSHLRSHMERLAATLKTTIYLCDSDSDVKCMALPAPPQVDSSLTTSEVQALLQSQGVDLRTAPLGVLDTLLPAAMPAHLQHQHELHGSAGSSGGYLEFVLRAAAWELFGKVVPPGPLPLKALRNPDMQVRDRGLRGEG